MRMTILILLFFAAASHAQWVQVNNGLEGLYIESLAVSGNNIFAGTGGNGIYLSTNNGTSWTQTSLTNSVVYSIAVNGSYIFAGTSSLGVYVSSNNGASWTQTPLNNQSIFSLAVSGNNIFAGTGDNQGVYLSTNNGINWTQTSLNNRIVLSLAVNGNNIFAGTAGYGVYLTTNNGTNWSQNSLINQVVYSLAVNGNNIFAGTGGYGVYISINNGMNWSQTSLNNKTVRALAVNGNYIFASQDTIGIVKVYVSGNNGISWIERSEGLGNAIISSFCILNNYIFAGRWWNAVYRRPLGELTAIQPISNNIPNEYSLSQNYPNPFNPTTKIKFAIPPLNLPLTGGDREGVLFKIYDLLGKDIVTLVNQQLTPGTYEVEWDASNYPSGIYFYRLSSGEFTQTNKMVLVK